MDRSLCLLIIIIIIVNGVFNGCSFIVFIEVFLIVMHV